VGVRVKLWNSLRTRAIPERFCDGDSLWRGASYIIYMDSTATRMREGKRSPVRTSAPVINRFF